MLLLANDDKSVLGEMTMRRRWTQPKNANKDGFSNISISMIITDWLLTTEKMEVELPHSGLYQPEPLTVFEKRQLNKSKLRQKLKKNKNKLRQKLLVNSYHENPAQK